MEKRYWSMELDKLNKDDLQKWIKDDELEAIVDEDAGGIIGYINRDHIESLIRKLNGDKNDISHIKVRFTVEDVEYD